MKKIRLIFGILMMSFLLCSCNSQDYSKAKEEYKKGEYEKAYDILADLDKYKDSTKLANDCCLKLSNIAGAEKKDEAIKWLKKMKKTGDDTYKEGMSKLIQLYCETEKFDEAIDLAKMLTEMTGDPKILNYSRYAYAQNLIEKKSYDSAKSILDIIGNSMDTKSLMDEINYGQAVQLYKEKDYTNAEKKFIKLIGMKDANKYLLKLVKKSEDITLFSEVAEKLGESKEIDELAYKLKYKNYKTNVIQGTMDAVQYTDTLEVEDVVSEKFYGTWKGYEEGDSPMTMDKYMLNGKRYGIYTLESELGWYYLGYYYFDKPQIIKYMVWNEFSVPSGQSQQQINACDSKKKNTNEFYYCSMNAEELDAYRQEVARNEEVYQEKMKKEEEEKRQNDNMKLLYEQAKRDYNEYYKSQFTGAYSLYTTVEFPDISDVSINYDEASEIYTLIFTAKTNSNIFDFYGGSKSDKSVIMTYKAHGNYFVKVSCIAQ